MNLLLQGEEGQLLRSGCEEKRRLGRQDGHMVHSGARGAEKLWEKEREREGGGGRKTEGGKERVGVKDREGGNERGRRGGERTGGALVTYQWIGKWLGTNARKSSG